ncbi:MAG: molybdopterin-dependent oxidoreductase [Proteobacteria bacterium]|nr:molybdopterin-dependent oxidoreductase [Pseudomonadota bacterium]
MAVERKPVLCRACHVQCGLLVDFEDGKPAKIHGDKDNPIYHGYSCVKGRQLASYHTLPSRLLHTQKRMPDGSHRAIPVTDAIAEIAGKMKTLIAAYGPRAVAGYIGTHGYNNYATQAFSYALLEAVGSPMMFTSVTIDQPGKGISAGLHGPWLAGVPPIGAWDVLMLIGTNPIVSMNGGLGANPARQLHEARKRGMKLIVIDPRRTDSAEQADIHLQLKPGEDPAVLAGIARILIHENLIDRSFVENESVGFDALRKAVEPFTPDVVEERADVKADDLVRAARLFGHAPRGAVSAGTGANMSGHGNLVEYFVKTLTTLRGFWSRAGDVVANPGVLVNRFPAIAASPGPFPAFGFGERMRVRGLTECASGLPTAAAADEILMPGEGQVKALFVFGGNPMVAWPDQLKTFEAMKALELLVTFDPHMSATSKLAHYVIAPKLPFEFASPSMLNETLGNFGPGWGYHLPYAQYSDPILDPPAGSDVIEEWEALYGIAQHLGVTLRIKDLSLLDPKESKEKGTVLDMARRYTADDIWAMLTKNSPVPLADVKAKGRAGHVFDRPKLVVQPKPAGWTGKLDIGNPVMMAELNAISEAPGVRLDNQFPYRMVSRRLHDVLNSCWHEDPILKKRVRYNSAFMNPTDMTREGIASGQIVELESNRSAIRAIVMAEDGVKAGCISMSHAWGGNPGEDDDPFELGSNTGRLSPVDRDYDPYSGIPIMSAIPVRLRV